METGSIMSKYALITKKTEFKMHIGDALVGEKPFKKRTISLQGSSLPVEAGSLVKIFRNEGDIYIVQILDYINHEFIYENLYECPVGLLRSVSDELWPYVISISKADRRLNVVNSQDRWFTYLKVNSLISVKGELFDKNSIRYDCIVRYIGPVEELHPVGYFFGLELLHLDHGHSPQSEDIPFAIKYMNCDPSLAIFTTADWITPISNEVKKKFSAKQLLSETFEKVVNVIAPTGICTTTSVTTSTASASTQRRDKHFKPKIATAQFYDNEPVKELNKNSANMDKRYQKQILLPGNMTRDEQTNVCQTENEEFKQSIENYEKNVERQHAWGSQPSHSIVTGGLRDFKAQSNINVENESKKTTITLKDPLEREIIIIDNADICESTKNESDVIVVDKHEDVDLAELLGENWPKIAGGAATILNRSQKQRERDRETQFNNDMQNQISTNRVPIDTYKTSKLSMEINTGDHHSSFEENENVSGIPTDFVFQTLQEVPGTGLTLGSLVEILLAEDLYGVIRWIGVPPGENNDVMIGVELEDDRNIKEIPMTDGSYNGIRLFQCHEGRAVFVSPEKCAIDKRFIDVDGSASNKILNGTHSDAKMFGHIDCPSIAGAVPPLTLNNISELEDICGKFKGIQGHHNSCYLDATLFSMFTFTSVFDSLLYRTPDSEDISDYMEVQKVLREEIVNPLRKNVFVRADRVMKLRKLLDQLSSVSGLTSEEKDPEEFLNSLLAQIMRVEPFLKLSSGQDSYFYQLFVEKDERLSFPTVQQLFEQSFHSSDIKLTEVPSCLIIQMPRFGKNYKMYPRILPSQVLDVTDIIEDSPRQCSVCGKLADYECRECFGSLQGGVGLECTAFCQKCLNTVHMHNKRFNHTSRKLSVPKDFKIMAEHMAVPRLYMELFAVVCIETSHYVAFVKAGSGPDAPWCFFDSMADRKGEKNGYNIPEMISVRELPQWLSDEGARTVNETSTNDKVLPEHAKRLFCDAYMCMYQSTDVMMYR